ncbi:MAG: hypothetical protein WBN02_13020 [Sedimenticolaceae bacterium]|jgi:hypothetical protein
MYNKALTGFLLGLLIGGCSGPYMVEEENIQDGMVTGEESVAVDGSGRVTDVEQQGFVPNNRFLDDYETGDVNLGPNAPGYIPPE